MKCKHKKENGEQCNSSAMNGSNYCYFHNPTISKEEKKDVQARGGKNRAAILKEPLSEIRIKKMPDITCLLVNTINQVRTGKMDAKIANCIGFLSDKLIKTLEASNLEERLKKIEQLIMGK